MAGDVAVVGIVGSILNHLHRHHEPCSSLITSPAWAAMWAMGAQRDPWISLQHPLRRVQGLVDRLSNNAHTVIDSDGSRGLLRTPTLVEVALNDLAQFEVNLEPAWPRTRSASEHRCVSSVRPVSAAAISGRIPLQLSADRRHRPTQLGSDGPRGSSSTITISNRDPFVLAQVPAR